MNINEKAAPVATGNGFNQTENADGIFQGFDFADFGINQEKLQSDIENYLISRKPKIHKLFLCDHCKKPFTITKLRRSGICKNCISSAQTKSPAAQRRFLASATANFQRSLKSELKM